MAGVWGVSHSGSSVEVCRGPSSPEVLTHLTVVPTLIVRFAGSNRNIAPAVPGTSCICTLTTLAGLAFESATATGPAAAETAGTDVIAGGTLFASRSLR